MTARRSVAADVGTASIARRSVAADVGAAIHAGAVALVVALALAPGEAAADPLDLGPARLTLDATWTGPAIDPAADPAALLATPIARRAGDAELVVVRYDVPNTEAWRDRTRKAHVDAIVAGFAAMPGHTALTHEVRRLGRASVPTLDLRFRRRGAAGDEVVAVRILLFRTMTLAAVAAAPADRALVERAATSLAPE